MIKSVKHAVFGILPVSLAYYLRRMKHLPADLLDRIAGPQRVMVPPRHRYLHIVNATPESYDEGRKHSVELLKEYGKLKRGDVVLEVGCGTGRVASGLILHHDEQLEYHGMDIVPNAIRWCRRNITAKYPAVRFHLSDIYNKRYNAGGKLNPAEYKFPFEDDTFDFVFLTSVFTHLLPGAVENYVCEIGRVLKPGGRFYISFFLFNEAAETPHLGEWQEPGDSIYRIKNPRVPEQAAAYSAQYVFKLFGENGLDIDSPVLYGSWRGIPSPAYQDVVLGTRG